MCKAISFNRLFEQVKVCFTFGLLAAALTYESGSACLSSLRVSFKEAIPPPLRQLHITIRVAGIENLLRNCQHIAV